MGDRREEVLRVLNDSGAYETMEDVADAVIAAILGPTSEELEAEYIAALDAELRDVPDAIWRIRRLPEMVAEPNDGGHSLVRRSDVLDILRRLQSRS